MAILLLFAVALAHLTPPARGTPRGTVTLIQGGRARCAVVVPAGASPNVQAAAEDLRDHLFRMSGARVPMVTHPAAPRGVPIYVGVRPPGVRLPVDPDDARRFWPDGYLLLAREGCVALLAPRTEGVVNAVYGLLEDFLGCRWFTPGEIGTVIPRRRTVRLRVPRGWTAVRPAFEVRSPWYNGNAAARQTPEENAEMARWRTRNRAGGLRGYGGHIWSDIWPRQLQEREPGLAPFFNGKRNPGGGQVCMSHPQAVPIAAEFFDRVFRDHPELDYYSFSQNDGAGWCECPDCLAMAAGHGARMLLFSNRVAERVAQAHPGKGIAILPYADTIEPPEAPIPGHPDLYPIICSYSMEQVRPKTDDNDWCRTFRRRAERWMKILPRAWSYDYIGWYPGPWTLFRKLQAEQDYYRRLGYTGMMPEYLDRNLGTDVHQWLSFRIAWDAGLRVETLLDGFYRAYFGEAASEMRALYEEFERHMLSVGGTGEVMDVPRLYPPERVERALRRIARARGKAAGDPAVAARLARDENCLRLTKEWLEFWAASGRFRRSGRPEERERAVASARAYLERCDRLDGTLTVGKAARAYVASTLESLSDLGLVFTQPGPFHYLDVLDDGGKAWQARIRSGFSIGTYGLYLPAGGTGVLVYEASAGEGLRFKEARLVATYFTLPAGGHNRIEVSLDEGRTWAVAFQDVAMAGPPAEHDLTPLVGGASRFWLRFQIENRSDGEILGMDQWGIAGTVE